MVDLVSVVDLVRATLHPLLERALGMEEAVVGTAALRHRAQLHGEPLLIRLSGKTPKKDPRQIVCNHEIEVWRCLDFTEVAHYGDSGLNPLATNDGQSKP